MIRYFISFYFLLFGISINLYSNEIDDISMLLEKYKYESESSKISKSESAGFVDTYSRNDLEKMQVQTLDDIYKLFTVPNISRTSTGLTLLTKPTNYAMPNSAIRLYINDHDMSASAYGSDALMWGSLPIEFIDHIVVYRSSTSVEFGNEPGSVIIKLYTKEASVEEGGKVRIITDNKGSSSFHTYVAHNLKNDFSYFIYANSDNVYRTKYYNQTSEINSDYSQQNLYSNIKYNKWLIELASFQKDTNSFLGMGREHTPTDNSDGIESQHKYIHISKTFQDDLKLQISYDKLDYEAYYEDLSGIYAGEFGFVSTAYMKYDDTILSTTLDKQYNSSNNQLLLGSFIKIKNSDVNSAYGSYINNYSNSHDLYSIYSEDRYSIDQSMMLILSLKFDRYIYENEIQSHTDYIARVGAIKNINNFQLKIFYSRNYYATAMAYMYNGDNETPYITNPDLNFAQPTLLNLGFKYKTKQHEADFRFADISVKDKVYYNADPTKGDIGFVNLDKSSYQQYEFKYIYKINHSNKIGFDIYSGENGDNPDFSPKYGAHIFAYNSYQKFDFYNEIDYRSSYSAFGVDADESYNLTSAIKYHYNNDLTFGLKGENILDKGFEQIYQGLSEPVPVFDKKYWLNMEYLF